MEIDAVITWVDSSDDKWRNKINNYLDKKIDWENKKESTRFNSINEVEITILSIIKYATFIKRIFLVTDNQQPNEFEKLKKIALNNNVKLELIDHKVIFRGYEEYLPTFNSCSIITALYRIPSLSEHFIIFNDDTFLMDDCIIEDFFIKGSPLIRGYWSKFYEDQIYRKIFIKVKSIFKKVEINQTGYKLAQQKSAKLLGLKKYIVRDHTPVPVKKSTLMMYFEENPLFLENNLKHRFRNNTQFIISSLSHHLQVIKNDYYLSNDYKLTYFQSYNYINVVLKLFKFDFLSNNKFMCFQSLETSNRKSLEYILKWIDSKLK